MRKPSKTNSLQTVEKAFRILETLAKKQEEMGLLEISKKIQMNKSTVYRFLSTLSNMGYVKQNFQTNKYHLGLKILEISRAALDRLELREEAKPFMKCLMNETGGTVRLAILDGGEIVYIDQMDGNNPIKLQMRIGSRYPTHSTGAGKALLAYLPEEDLDDIIKKYGLPKYTPNTITDVRKLKS